MVTSSWHKWSVLIALVLLGCGGPGPSSDAPQEPSTLSKQAPAKIVPWRVSEIRDPKLFTTPQGLRIELVPLDSTVDSTPMGHYLLRMSGTQNELDGIVLFVRETKNGGYRTTLRGQPIIPLYSDQKMSPNGREASGWFYRANGSLYGTTPLDVGNGKGIDATGILERYKKQEESGLNEKIAPVERAVLEGIHENAIQEYLASEEHKACGRLRMSVDWSTVEDSWFHEFSVGNACLSNLTYLESFCSRFPNRLSDVQAASNLECVFDGHPSAGDFVLPRLTKTGGLRFVPRDANIVDNSIQRAFRKMFGEQEQVLRGKQVYFIARDEADGSRYLYQGDGKTFYPSGPLSENVGVDYKSIVGSHVEGELVRREGKWTLACEHSKEDLDFLVGKEREAILRAASFEKEPKWKRAPYFLARDTRGTYYYVDRVMERYGGRNYRVYTGRRGQLKLTKLEGVVDDSVGTVFSTDDGELRLVVASKSRQPSATWIRGKQKTVLTAVDVHANKNLIYDELGAYFGEDMGFVCSN